MRILPTVCLLIVCAGGHAAAESQCGTFPIEFPSLDLAPPPGFVEVCSRNAQLCEVLTRGYPPSVTTRGYFVTEEEWNRFAETEELGFTAYLIAQTSGTKSAEEFKQFKEYVIAQQGEVPDHTELPSFLKKNGQVSLGVLDEADDLITIGTVMHLAAPQGKVALAATNVALQLPGSSLILYVFNAYNGPSDVVELRALTDQWVQCLRSSNEAVNDRGHR